MKRKDRDMIKGMKSSISEKTAEKIRAEKRAKQKEVKRANRKRNLMILGGIIVATLIIFAVVAISNRTPSTTTPDNIPEPEETVFNTAVIETSKGTIEVELLIDDAPLTTENFNKHAAAGHYDNTFFHRIVAGSSMEAAVYPDSPMRPGYDDVMVVEPTVVTGLEYTLSTVLQPSVDGVMKQSFFKINKGMPDDGGTVFAKITKGQEIVDQMLTVSTVAHVKDNSFDIAEGEITYPENPDDVRIYSISFQ